MPVERARPFKLLSAELAALEGMDFQRRVLPLLRLKWAPLIGTPPTRSLDTRGADLVVWDDGPVFPLAVQCKGFRVSGTDLATRQIADCRASIAAFRASGLQAGLYLLVHNRPAEPLRTALKNALAELVDVGVAREAAVWDRDLLLHEVFAAVHRRASSAVASNSARLARTDQRFEPQICKPLRAVPVKVSDLRVSPYRLETIGEGTPLLADPAELGIFSGSPKLIFLIGEAGMGKTTTVLEGFASRGHHTLYLPAAAVGEHTESTADLLGHSLDADEILRELEPESRKDARRILKSVITHLYKEEGTKLVLILDGLDESLFFARPAAMQRLVNLARGLRTPVVLTARTAYWRDRLTDFATAFGRRTEKRAAQMQFMKLVELLPWGDDQLVALARRYAEAFEPGPARDRLDQLAELFSTGSYEKYYGDIPRRPLFLRLILETVAERRIDRAGRARLLWDWATLKIERDRSAPMRYGRTERLPIVPDAASIRTTIEIAFSCMMTAASKMTRIVRGSLELLPDCPLSDVILEQPRLRSMTEPLGLYLNTLLVPVAGAGLGEPRRVMFAHRVYQEFFLALYLRTHEPTASVPVSVRDWMVDADADGL